MQIQQFMEENYIAIFFNKNDYDKSRSEEGRVNEFEQNDTPSRFSDSYGDSLSVCVISDNQQFYGEFLCVPYPAARVHYDDGGS